MFRTPPLWLGVVLTLAVVLAAGFALSAPVGGDDIDTDRACTDHLGDEWEAAGIAKHDDCTHYHVQCERSTGFLSGEEQWVTIEAGEYEIHEI